MAYDGSIRINTRIDGKGFNTGVKSMMASLGSLAAAIGVVFSVQQMVQFGKTSVQTAMQMEAGWQGLRYMANAYGKDLGHIKEFLKEYTEDGLVPMMNAQQAYKNMLARGYSTDQLEKMLLIMKDSSVYLRKGQLGIGEAIEKTTMGLRTERSILTDSSGIEKNMYKMWQAYAKEMGTTISALTHEQKLIAEFQGFMKEGAVYAGAAAEYTETYAGKVAQLTAAMVGLKVSVGNMLIPLLNAILPKIIAMVKWFTYWFNIIGRVMNLLFGTQVGASSLDGVADDAYDAADAQDKLGDATERAGKAAKGALASFDKLNVLAQETEKAGAGGGGDVGLPVEEEGLFPEMEEQLDEMEEKLRGFVARVKEFFAPLGEAFSNLMVALEPVKTFVATGLQSFYDNLLVPIGTWVMGEGLPTFVNTLTTMVNNLDLTGMNTALTNLWNAIAPFAINVGEGLLWFWETVISPIVTWVWNDLLPTFLDLLTAAVGALDAIIGDEGGGASQGIKIFWDNVLAPILNFAETLIVGIIEDLTDALTAFGDWCSENEGTVSLMTTVILTFLAELWLYNTGKKVAAWITTSLVPAINSFAASLATLNIPLILSAIGVAALVTGITALALVWDKLTPAERTEAMLRGLTAALIAAAIAVAVFHTSWTVGIAAAAIVGGLALLASASYLSGMSIPDIFSQGMGSPSAMQDAINTNYSTSPLPALASGAVIPPNAPFAAILGDQKHGTNIEAPESLLRDLIREELGRNQQGTQTLHNVIKLDGQVLYEAVKKIDRRVGTSLISGSGIR